MKHALLLSGLLLAGCSLFTDDLPTTSVFASEVRVQAIEKRTVLFDYKGRLPDPCWEYDRTDIDREEMSITVDLRYRSDGSSVCPDVIAGVEREVAVRVPKPGDYTFRFPSGPDETLDVVVTVP